MVLQCSKGCVLVVDDELDLCETVRTVLQLEGYDVLTSTDAVKALARLRDGVRPCLILLDIMMPGMDGIQFRRELMSDPALRDIPVLALTGASEAVVNRVAALGLQAMRKPVRLEPLLEVVDRFCRPYGDAREQAPPPSS
jgi:CheY-like chemotaxis protein